MFTVKTYIVPADRVRDSYATKWTFDTQQDAMCCVGQYLSRGHIVVLNRPATNLFPASAVCYTLDLRADPIADDLINAYCDALDERDGDVGC